MDDETNNETETEDELAQQDGTVLPAREVMSLLSTSPASAAALADSGADIGTDFPTRPDSEHPLPAAPDASYEDDGSML
jgi:hypothetical protein